MITWFYQLWGKCAWQRVEDGGDIGRLKSGIRAVDANEMDWNSEHRKLQQENMNIE